MAMMDEDRISIGSILRNGFNNSFNREMGTDVPSSTHSKWHGSYAFIGKYSTSMCSGK